MPLKKKLQCLGNNHSGATEHRSLQFPQPAFYTAGPTAHSIWLVPWLKNEFSYILESLQ